MNRLMPFQEVGVAWLLAHEGRGLLADEQGLGKTVQAARWLRASPAARPALVICPASLKPQWQSELRRWAGIGAEVLNGAPKARAWSGVYVTNYDALSRWAPIMAGAFKAVVLDEVHYLKNPRAKRTKAVMIICKGVPHVIALSGTPVINRPAEFWTTLRLLDPGAFPTFWSFAQRYCGLHHNGFGWKWDGATHLPELRERLKPLMLRRLKADVLPELPPKARHVVEVAWDRAAYRRALEPVEKPGGIEPPGPASIIPSRGILPPVNAPLDPHSLLSQVKRATALAKLDACVEWARSYLDGCPGKLVLFAEHHAVLDGLKTGLGEVCLGPVDGRMAIPDRTRTVERFMRDPKARVICGHVRVLGTGWTLTAADTCAFIELPWTPGELVQAEDRIHRIGQESGSVTVYYMVASASLDVDLARLLAGKRKVLARLLDKGRAGNVRSLDVRRELMEIVKRGGYGT